MAERDTGALALVAVDAGVWFALSVVIGFIGARVPGHRLAHDGPLTRLRRFERGGRRWEAVGVRRWKDGLPEAGALFGGVSKRRLGGRRGEGPRRRGADPAPGLERLVIETRRAELVHWALVATTPVFALWNPPIMTLAMAVFAVVANAPCIIVQRFNRGRFQRVLDRRARLRSAPVG